MNLAQVSKQKKKIIKNDCVVYDFKQILKMIKSKSIIILKQILRTTNCLT